jgi:putative redox protein
MILHSIDTRWLDGMAFENTVDGHSFTVDAAQQFGGRNLGPRPKLLLLNALAGCTGMDVVSMLTKMKQNLSWFNIHVEGDLGDEHPKTYQAIRLAYQFRKSDDLDETKVIKAVTMSQEQYCGVSAMLKKVCDLTWEVVYLD